MDLFQSCLFNSMHLLTLEKKYGSSPRDERVIQEITQIANFFFDQMEWRFSHECPRITA